MSSFTIEIAGDPAAIRAAGEWVRHQVESAAREVDIVAGLMGASSYLYWQGESGDAFADVMTDLSSMARELDDFAGPFAEKLHVYAGEVERIKNRFEGYLDHARSVGLDVSGVRVSQPQWVGNVPQGNSDPSWDEWREHRKKLREYDRILDDVLSRHAENIAWITENFMVLAGEAPGETLADQLCDQISSVLGIGAEFGQHYLNASLTSQIDGLRGAASVLTTEASEIVRRSTASGNPATRAELREKIQQNLPEHLRATAAGAETAADLTRMFRKVSDVALGPGADIALAAWQLAEGAEPVDVAVDVVGGIAGGAAAVALGATPIGWGAVIIAGAGWAGSEIASGIWQSTPESWREGIYHWVDDGIVIGQDIAEDIGDWFYDTSEAIGGWFK